MILHAPFVITPRLCAGLQIGDGWLSLMSAYQGPVESCLGARTTATLIIDLPGGIEYICDDLSSGCGGFGGYVAIFESFLGFLEAAMESYEFEQRYPGRKGENTDLFPLHVLQWACDNKCDIEGFRYEMYVEGGSDYVNEALIEA